MYFLDSIFYDNNDYIYSIDMIRINFELNESIIDINDKFYEYLHDFSSSQFCLLKTFFNKSYGYRYLYNLQIDSTDEKCSFVIGLQLGSRSENKNKGFIEFNPNKCFNSSIFNYHYNKFKELCYSFKVIRYDLAVDLPIKRDYIKLVRYRNCNYSYEYYENNGINLNSSITEYLGRRNHNKFTKVYDKTKESNLDYDLTRIEFTFDRDFEDFKTIPNFINLYNKDLLLESNKLILLNLLIESNDFNYYYKLLSYRKRKSLEPFLNNYYVKFDLTKFYLLRGWVLSFEF